MSLLDPAILDTLLRIEEQTKRTNELLEALIALLKEEPRR
jgi:hypothetical protein